MFLSTPFVRFVSPRTATFIRITNSNNNVALGEGGRAELSVFYPTPNFDVILFIGITGGYTKVSGWVLAVKHKS